jgi:subtilisin family serine protease
VIIPARVPKAVKTAVVILTLLLAWALPLAVSGPPPAEGADALRPAYAPGEVLVKYRPAGRPAAGRDRDRHGARTLRVFEAHGVHHLRLPEGVSVAAALDFYRSDPDVELVEPNYYRYLRRTPNDPAYGSQWGMTKIGAPAAWETATDCSAAVVALVDSGADHTHPDLAANIWVNPGEIAGNGVDDDGNGKVDDTVGWDFVSSKTPSGDNDPIDEHGHGTHVAGTIAAAGDNARGVAGVCWSARIMVLRAFDSEGYGTVADIVAAFDYARLMGARVVNASFASSTPSDSERDAVALLNAAGILLVAAAGNGDSSGEAVDNDLYPSYPASYDLPNIISVTATDSSDRLAAFANFGALAVDVAAPGVSVFSTYLGAQSDVLTEGFEVGTAGWALDAPIGRESGGAYAGTWTLADSPGVDYANGIDVAARSPAFSMAGRSRALLEFYLKGRMMSGDTLRVETATGPAGPWTNRPALVCLTSLCDDYNDGISGDFPDWRFVQVYLEGLDGAAEVYFRFRFVTNGNGVAEGYLIDEIAVTTLGTGQDDYATASGTSFSAAHVSGLAALIWGTDPALSAGQVKAFILDGAEPIPALEPKILTGGRISALQSLLAATAPAPAGGGGGGGGCFISTALGR